MAMDSPSLLPQVQLPKMSALKEKCRSCKFWFAQEMVKTGEGDVSPCRRFPPTMVLGPNPRPLPGQLPVAPARLPDPATPADHWCGEYKTRIRIAGLEQFNDGNE